MNRGTSLAEAWEKEEVKNPPPPNIPQFMQALPNRPTIQQPSVGPTQNHHHHHQTPFIPSPPVSQDTTWMYAAPQQQATILEPVDVGVDVVDQVNHMLNQTEQYLLQQIAELHRATHVNLTRALASKDQVDVESTQNPSKPYFITLIVLACVIIVILFVLYAMISKKLKILNLPQNEILNFVQ